MEAVWLSKEISLLYFHFLLLLGVIIDERIVYWIYALFVFGLPAAFAYYFIRGAKEKRQRAQGEKWKFTEDHKKQIGIAIVSMILGYLTTVVIKFVRGVEMNFWQLFLIVTSITWAIVYYLITKKNKK